MSLKERTSSAESEEHFVSRISLAAGGRTALPIAPNTPEPAYHLTVWPDPSSAPSAGSHKPTGEKKHRRRSVEGANTRLKKKTVAFGRTVNVSQTIEGTASRKANQPVNTMAKSSNNEDLLLQLKATVEQQGEAIKELQKSAKTVEDLDTVVKANVQEMTKMTEILQQVLHCVQPGQESAKKRTTTVAQQLRQRPSPSQLDKENVTPKPTEVRVDEESSVDNVNDIMKRLSRVQHMFLPKEPKQSVDNGRSWSLLLSKASNNPDLQRDLAQLTMKYANDESLVRLDRRAQAEPSTHQSRRPSPPMSPPYRTTRRTMTLQEEVTCVDSPPKYSAAYSQDTRLFFGRHGLDGRANRVGGQQHLRRRLASNHDDQLDNFTDDDDEDRYAAPRQPYDVAETEDDDDDDDAALLDGSPACKCRPLRCYHR